MVTIISSTEDFKYIIGQRTPVVASFWVDGSEVCDAINGLAKAYHAVHFVKVKANEVPDLAESEQITRHPTFVTYLRGRRLDKVESNDPDELNHSVATLANTFRL